VAATAGGTFDVIAAGGGGLGAGGDIYVQQGGILTIENSALSAGAVTGGAAGAVVAGAGQAYGGGIFLQGSQTIDIAAAAGQMTTVAGVIADQSGSGGSGANAGAGSVVIGNLTGNATGVVAFTAANTYVGGTMIDSGSLALLNRRLPVAAPSHSVHRAGCWKSPPQTCHPIPSKVFPRAMRSSCRASITLMPRHW
jgi:hypothetical protein